MLHQIGIGALGPVFRTYEPIRDRLVAVKVFRLDIVPEQAQALATALGRAAASSLFHPSIVEPIAAGVEGTVAYRAEQYVAAESLDVAMRHYAPATIDKVLPFITQLAGAIDFARAAGVGHGGLHPRDIFVTPDEARATGFGVVEALEEAGIRAPVRRPYTAPERIDGHTWSTPADVFSLAAITFELLTGRRPAGMGALMGSLPEGEHSAALHAVLARAMDPDPTQRFGGALAFAAALESAGRGQPVASSVTEITAIATPSAAVPAKTTSPPPPPVPQRLESEPSPDSAPKPVVVPTPPIAVDSKREPAPPPRPMPAPEPARASGPARASEPARGPEPVAAPDKEADLEPTLFDAGEQTIAAVPIEPYVDDFVEERDLRTLFNARDEPVEPVEPEPVQPKKLLEPDEPVAEPTMFEAPDSSRPAVLPTAVGVVLGLLAGFAGGYFVGSRDRLAPELASTTASTTATPPGNAAVPPSPGGSGTATGAATRDQAGQFSEQKVGQPPASAATAAPDTRPPAEAPPVVSEGEPARSATPRGAATPPRDHARPAAGSIVVKSTPSRAGVVVNGAWRGRTPLTLDRVAFGKYVVRIVQPGYHVAQDEFTLGARDAEHTFTAKLEPTAASATAKKESAPAKGESSAAPTGGFVGTLFVDSRPRGASVVLDGRNIGVTPLSLDNIPIGSHVVRIEMAGKKPWSAETRVVAGETARVTGSLEDRQ